jgi:hypothetical protein
LRTIKAIASGSNILQDPLDNDDRLNPRLKIKKITDPEGTVLEYQYSHDKHQTTAVVSRNGVIDRQIRYEYLRDERDTGQRYVTLREVKVTRGFLLNMSGNVTGIPGGAPQVVQDRSVFSSDGRFNLEKKVDSLNREIKFEHNEFNQLVRQWDVDNHWTKHT